MYFVYRASQYAAFGGFGESDIVFLLIADFE